MAVVAGRLPWRCLVCKREVADDQVKCTGCGHKLTNKIKEQGR